jgi:adenosine kinase
LKLLGIDPIIFSSAGNDFQIYKEFLEKNKISTNFIKIFSKETTGSYFVVTDQEDNQIGSFYQGATIYNKDLSIKNIYSSNPDSNRGEKLTLKTNHFVIISPNEPKAMIRYVNECIKLKLPYMYDPAFQIDSFQIKDLKEAIVHSQIFIANDYEMTLVEKKLTISHQELIKLTKICITTLGSKGSIIESGSQKTQIVPAKPKNVSDPTGAGDAYRSGFLAGFLRGFDLKTCGQMGSIAAVYTVEKYGTQTHSYSIKDFLLRYQKNYGEKLKIS